MIIYNWTFVINLLKHILTALKNIPTHYCGRPGHSLWPDFVFLNFNWICPHTFKIHSATLFSLRKSFTHFNFILCWCLIFHLLHLPQIPLCFRYHCLQCCHMFTLPFCSHFRSFLLRLHTTTSTISLWDLAVCPVM